MITSEFAAKTAVRLVDEEYHMPEKRCLWCKKKYYPKQERQLYCSLECRTEAEKKKYAQKHGKIKKKKCVICGKTFMPRTRDPKASYCSDKCRHAERNKLNLTKALAREYFLERANFTCNRCEVTGTHLECHHVIPIYKGGKDVIDNIEVLCDKCHQIAHEII